MYTFEEPFSGTCKRIDLGGFTVSFLGIGEVGVDFDVDTVEDEMVMALPEDGGMVDFGAGVCVGGLFSLGVLVSSFFGVTMSSSWTGLRMSSTCARFLGITTVGGGERLVSNEFSLGSEDVAVPFG